MLLTVIIPCYNEKSNLKKIINLINNVKIQKEIILVDDCSNDGTRELIESQIKDLVSKVVFHERRLGKGGCIKTAKKYVSGDIVIIQDADLEYDPNDYIHLIRPIFDEKFQVVYGSRLLKSSGKQVFVSKFRIFVNWILTKISNFLNNQELTDAHTCYKVFSKKIFDEIILENNDFSFCPEVTTKLSNLGIKIKELPINYYGRTEKEGKKIKWFDGVIAIFTIIKFRKRNS